MSGRRLAAARARRTLDGRSAGGKARLPVDDIRVEAEHLGAPQRPSPAPQQYCLAIGLHLGELLSNEGRLTGSYKRRVAHSQPKELRKCSAGAISLSFRPLYCNKGRFIWGAKTFLDVS